MRLVTVLAAQMGSEPATESGPADTEPEEDGPGAVITSQALQVLQRVRTRHFVAFLMHAVSGTPHAIAGPDDLPGQECAGDKLLR
jgi:hypothetical protein